MSNETFKVINVSGEQLVRANLAAKLAELGYPEV